MSRIFTEVSNPESLVTKFRNCGRDCGCSRLQKNDRYGIEQIELTEAECTTVLKNAKVKAEEKEEEGDTPTSSRFLVAIAPNDQDIREAPTTVVVGTNHRIFVLFETPGCWILSHARCKTASSHT